MMFFWTASIEECISNFEGCSTCVLCVLSDRLFVQVKNSIKNNQKFKICERKPLASTAFVRSDPSVIIISLSVEIIESNTKSVCN